MPSGISASWGLGLEVLHDGLRSRSLATGSNLIFRFLTLWCGLLCWYLILFDNERFFCVHPYERSIRERDFDAIWPAPSSVTPLVATFAGLRTANCRTLQLFYQRQVIWEVWITMNWCKTTTLVQTFRHDNIGRFTFWRAVYFQFSSLSEL